MCGVLADSGLWSLSVTDIVTGLRELPGYPPPTGARCDWPWKAGIQPGRIRPAPSRTTLSTQSRSTEIPPGAGDIALIVTAVGVVAAVFGLRQNNRERLRQFEAMYVQWYWSILDQLSPGVLAGSTGEPAREADVKGICAYLFLCADVKLGFSGT